MTETTKQLKLNKQILTCVSSMNQSSLSHQLQQKANHNSGGENQQPNMTPNLNFYKLNAPQTKNKKKVFEYRGSTDLAARMLNKNLVLSQKEKNKGRSRVEDYTRQQTSLNEQAQGSGAPTSQLQTSSFGLSEIKSSPKNQASNFQIKTQPIDVLTRPSSAYHLKRQQNRQNGRNSGKEACAEGIVGRRVDAPHIIFPQGSVVKSEYEQGQISNTYQMLAIRGAHTAQTISLSPKHSPWKKASSKNATSNYAIGKTKNLFGQVKLSLNQKKSEKTVQKNFKSQPGKNDEVKNGRSSKSMEQVKNIQRQLNFPVGGSTSHNKPRQGQDQHGLKKVSHIQQPSNAGRKTVMNIHERGGELSTENLKQKRSGATTRLQRSQLNNFLDQSLVHQQPERAGNNSTIQIQNQSSELVQNQITLNILTASADQFANQGSSAGPLNYQADAKCKSVVARHHLKDHSRQLIQAKYLNFQRESHQSKKRGQSVQEHIRVNPHRISSGGSRAQAQTAGVTKDRSKVPSGTNPTNPFRQISSSQGRASGSGGTVLASLGHLRAFGATKNQTIEIELRRRSKSRQAVSRVLSDTPDKEKNRQRARSGGSSNKRKQQILGVSSSFSPRSRATQFQEARSLLFENQSSGLSVGSKKQNLNQLLSNLDGRHKKTSNKKLTGSSQEQIAQKQSSSMIYRQQSTAIGASAIHLTSPIDPNNNLSMLLGTANDQSVQQYLQVSNENLRSTICETQVGNASGQGNSQQLIKFQDEGRSNASKMAHLNASLGRILNHSSLTQHYQQRGGSSQSPRGGSRGRIQPGGKASTVISASNTSRIDKIIQDNLKKQSKKTMQRKLREQVEEQVSRKKKAELELVNERVRKANQEKVQKRKIQQMLLIHTNNTMKAGKSLAVERDSADHIRDEMTRMLDELPENAIVKTYKGSKKLNGNLQSLQQSDTTRKVSGKPPLDRSAASESNQAPQPKQLQARTQKIDFKFNSQQRIEGVILKLKQNADKNEGNLKSSDLPPKHLKVKRLPLSRKDYSGEPERRNRQRSQERDKQSHQKVHQPAVMADILPAEIASKNAGRFKDHRKSYGLEFIDIRKEINAELKQHGSRKSPRGQGKRKLRTNLRFIPNEKTAGETSEEGIFSNLRGSKSQRQMFLGQNAHHTTLGADDLENHNGRFNVDLMNNSSILQNQTAILKPHTTIITPLRINQSFGDKKTNQSMTNGNSIGIVLKKEKIRKFMLRKQKQKLEEEEKEKQEVIQKTLKVHEALFNLDKFAKKNFRIMPQAATGGPRTGKASQSKNRHNRNTLCARKNMTLVHEQKENDQIQALNDQTMTITPSKTGLEVSEPSFNVSAQLNQRVSSKQLKKTSKNTNVSQGAPTQNINPPHVDLSFLQQDVGNSSSRNRHRRSSNSRGNDNYVNRSVNHHLAPQFENSTSAKTLRTQLRVHKQTSSQSPPPQTSAHAGKVDQNTLKNLSKKDVGPKTKFLKHHVQVGGGLKRLKVEKKNTRKREKSFNKNSGAAINLNQNKQLNVRVPVIGKRSSRHQSSHRKNSSFHRSSIHTLESDQSHHRLGHPGSFKRHRMPSSLLSVQRMDPDFAATVIQKEVRKYLKQIGFYHANQINFSIDADPQISLFIEKRSRKSSKKSRQSRSGSRGRRQSPSVIVSDRPSPNQKLVETTFIAELSGFKQTDLFVDESSGIQSEVRADGTRQNNHLQKSGQRKGHQAKQQSSGSERDTSSKLGSRKTNKFPSSNNNKRLHDPEQPLKQLNPILRKIENPIEDKSKMLHEILSVQTPQSKNENVINLVKHQSLSARRILDSEFQFRQEQSSAESGSIGRQGINANGSHLNDAASHSSSSLFDRNAFQQYSQKKLKMIMQNSEHSKLIKFRQEVLKFQEQKERRLIRKQFKQNQFSPRTFQAKQKKIDRWVQLQKQDIEKTKTSFKEEWEKTVQMIDETQKNVDQMKSKMNLGPSHNSNSNILSVSGASAAKHQVFAAGNQFNNFNSQSCNSLSSHRNYQKAGSQSNGLGGGNLLALSGFGEHHRSILMEDPPKSYRSGRQEIPQMQILPIAGGVLPDHSVDEVGHGSMGLLSSRRSGGNGVQGDKLQSAQSLLQYMEKRLANHNQNKQTALQDLKSKGSELMYEDDYQKSDHHNKAKLIEQDDTILNRIKAVVGLDADQHSRKPSSASIVESDISHQPSAEFLERLERVNKQEHFISSVASDNLLASVDFRLDPLLQSVINSENGGIVGHVPEKEESLSQSDQFERGDFKNQVMTIKDFGGLDSKRTSQQSETSNEKDFQRMIQAQKNRSGNFITKKSDNHSDITSPTAEYLMEPSVISKRESQHASGSQTVEKSQSLAQNIRISDILKHQAKDIEDIIKETSHRSDLIQDNDLLQEPAIISSSQTLQSESTTFNLNQNNVNLIVAKTKPSVSPLKTEDILKILNSGDFQEKKKIVDQLTDQFIQSLVSECFDQPVRRGPTSGKPKENDSTPAQPNHDVYFIDQLQSEKEERKEWIELRQRHLIENDLIRIDQYVNEIVDALLQFEIDLSSEEDEGLLETEEERKRKQKELLDNYHIQFLKQLTQPIQKSSIEVLQNLQTSEIGSYKHFETTQDLQKHPIIPVNLYLEIEKAREEALLARKGPNMSKQTQMVWESIHIQNKSFFDAINESLMKFRPYGLTGEPMPWSNKVRRLQTKVDIGSVDTERLFQMVKQEVFRWSQAFCGALPSPVFCFPQNAQNRQKEEFNDSLFQENREKRLTQVLSSETVEQEHHWLNYEYEEAQVKVDLSDMILEHLVDELASFLINKSQGDEDRQVPAFRNATVYDLMTDEPEFSNSFQALVDPKKSPYSPDRIDLQLIDDQSTNSLQKLDNARRIEA